MKLFRPIALLGALLISTSSVSAASADRGYGYSSASTDSAAGYTQEPGGFEEFLDLVIVRPFALGGTIATTGLFIGLSPLVGLATLIEPHDAFQKVSDLLVIDPATYTFVRPLGVFR